MSEHQVLLNEDNCILAVGFDNDGNVVNSQFAHDGHTKTIQMDVDVVHTVDTYTGDDEYVKDFFSRKPGDVGYGILYGKDNKEVMLNIAKLQPTIFKLFEGIDENPHQPSLRHRLTLALMQGTIGLDDPDYNPSQTIDAFKEALGPLTDDTEPSRNRVIDLRFGTVTQPHSDLRADTFVWYQKDNGEWWYNNITAPELVSSSSSCTFDSISIDLSCNMAVQCPPEIKGVYFVVTLMQTRTQNTVKTTVVVDKRTADIAQPIKESTDVLPQK